jgi:anti-sigma factor RsiW
MSERLDCARVEERLSELYDDALAPAERLELERHLASCPRCRELYEALGEVVSALRSAPELEPARDLAERAASAALDAAAAARRRSSLRLVIPRLGTAARQVFVASVPAEVRWMAAALAIALTAAVLLAQSLVATPARAADRVVQRTMTAGAYVAERKDRLVEDLRLLRVVIRTAFEGRLDRVNDRVDDYRRLLERRRGTVPAGSAPEAKSPALEQGTRPTSQFVNFGLARAVAEGVTREAAGPASGPSTMRSRARRT